MQAIEEKRPTATSQSRFIEEWAQHATKKDDYTYEGLILDTDEEALLEMLAILYEYAEIVTITSNGESVTLVPCTDSNPRKWYYQEADMLCYTSEIANNICGTIINLYVVGEDIA